MKDCNGLFRLVRRRTTILPFFLLGLGFVSTTLAQPQLVTVRDINEISVDSVATLMAGGVNLTGAEIQSLIFNDLVGDTVQFTAVLMTDPFNSGLANLDGGGNPARIHVFVRDTSSVSLGNDGMGIQIVDDDYQTTGLLNVGIGDVVTIVGVVSPFLSTNVGVIQVAPETISSVGTMGDLGLPASLLDPVVITTDQANRAVGTADGVQTNWVNLADLRGQFVRVESALLHARSLATPARPDFYVSSDAGTTVLNFYDTSLRFRNDRSDYPAGFNVRTDDFVPPPPGAIVNIQGFLILQPSADQIGRSVPSDGFLSIVPFEDQGCGDPGSGLRCDFELIGLGSVTRYVDTTGSDFDNDCSNPLNPCATIAYAVSQANGGDILDVETGTYIEPGLLIEKKLIMQGQGVIVR